MKKSVFLFLVLVSAFNLLHAGKIDEEFLKKINGTKWDLTEEKKSGKILFRKSKTLIKESITFSDGSILFDLPDQNYACNFTLKNQHEFWLYCTEPDQYIYKIHSLNNRQLVMDLWIKDRKGTYIRTKRLSFHIHP
ncbi:MAG TPA: hypothetical protein VFJ43_13020 [Bacteroidia bacterium]|nr:hypothetical protein [Bacteroidia bacterium]